MVLLAVLAAFLIPASIERRDQGAAAPRHTLVPSRGSPGLGVRGRRARASDQRGGGARPGDRPDEDHGQGRSSHPFAPLLDHDPDGDRRCGMPVVAPAFDPSPVGVPVPRMLGRGAWNGCAGLDPDGRGIPLYRVAEFVLAVPILCAAAVVAVPPTRPRSTVARPGGSVSWPSLRP